jgi:hypothetical protein
VDPDRWTFEVVSGRISSGGNLLRETMTPEEAMLRAETLPACWGFCFRGEPVANQPVEVFFKEKWDNSADDETWTSYRVCTKGSAMTLETGYGTLENGYSPDGSSKRSISADPFTPRTPREQWVPRAALIMPERWEVAREEALTVAAGRQGAVSPRKTMYSQRAVRSKNFVVSIAEAGRMIHPAYYTRTTPIPGLQYDQHVASKPNEFDGPLRKPVVYSEKPTGGDNRALTPRKDNPWRKITGNEATPIRPKNGVTEKVNTADRAALKGRRKQPVKIGGTRHEPWVPRGSVPIAGKIGQTQR